MALAQHHGLPTPLLDWSRQAKVAAYFAASNAVGRTLAGDKLVVWAIRRRFDNYTLNDPADGRNRAVLWFHHAPRATNPNLHAQHGLFSQLHYSEGHAIPLDRYAREVCLQREDQLLGEGLSGPVMRRLTAPRDTAGQLLFALHLLGVDGSTMYPGYDGVVRAMQEEPFWRR
jgi:hypothetical protein